MVFDKTPSPASLADISLHLMDHNKKRFEIVHFTISLQLNTMKFSLSIVFKSIASVGLIDVECLSRILRSKSSSVYRVIIMKYIDV